MMTEDEKDVWKAAFAAAYVVYWSERKPGKTRSESIDTAQSRASGVVVAFRELRDAGLLPWDEGRGEK